MAQLPGRRAPHLAAGAALAAAWLGLALAFPAAAAQPLDLEGTWYVLVHYQDAESGRPDAWRWEDRVWVFERDGDRLAWTEYPIVVFSDESGRFEGLGTGRQHRVIAAWEPSPGQLGEIRAGLEVNSRGSRTKTLRASAADGWRSGASARPRSASVITYSETWSVTDPEGMPRFLREDFLSSARAVGMEGRTEYRTREVLETGALLRGDYARDGTRSGGFRMWRAGGVETVKGSGKTLTERAVELYTGGAAISLQEREGLTALLAAEESSGQVSPTHRERVRHEIHALLRDFVSERGQDPALMPSQIDSLAGQIERALLDEGRSLEEVERMLRDGRLAP